MLNIINSWLEEFKSYALQEILQIDKADALLTETKSKTTEGLWLGSNNSS